MYQPGTSGYGVTPAEEEYDVDLTGDDDDVVDVEDEWNGGDEEEVEETAADQTICLDQPDSGDIPESSESSASREEIDNHSSSSEHNPPKTKLADSNLRPDASVFAHKQLPEVTSIQQIPNLADGRATDHADDGLLTTEEDFPTTTLTKSHSPTESTLNPELSGPDILRGDTTPPIRPTPDDLLWSPAPNTPRSLIRKLTDLPITPEDPSGTSSSHSVDPTALRDPSSTQLETVTDEPEPNERPQRQRRPPRRLTYDALGKPSFYTFFADIGPFYFCLH